MKKYKPTNTQIIVFAFAMLIIVGGFLLTLPIASRGAGGTSFLNAIFTATSAVCVTGLVVVDTYTYWSPFGQAVILCLIQIGGIGFMTILTLFSMFLGRKIGLAERQIIMQASGMLYMGGAIRLLKKIIIGTLIFQGTGILILSLRFVPEFGLELGIFKAVFHSVSAFCNAGFDLMGSLGSGHEFTSLATAIDDPIVLLTVSALFIIGGLGFLVWNDFYQHGLRFRKFALHTKIVLTMTVTLLSVSFIMFLITEWNHSMEGMKLPVRLLNSFFQGATPRTAGFATLDMGTLSEPGKLATMFLMFVGGNPGSTAGGLKTTTLLVLVLNAMNLSRKNKNTALFNRRLSDDTVANAHALFTIYSSIIVFAVFLISIFEEFSLQEIAFEVISAIGTVGLSFGITPELGSDSRVVIILLMFVGRVGFITLLMALFGKRHENSQTYVPEKILIG